MTASPSPDAGIDDYISKLKGQGNHDPAFLAQYKQVLKDLAQLGTAQFGPLREPFSFYEMAANIPLPFLLHRDNLDRASNTMAHRAGQGILDHLSNLAADIRTTTNPAALRSTSVFLREILIELSNPYTTTQSGHGTCAPEAMSTQLLLTNPAEWTRIALGLLQSNPHEVSTFDPTKKLQAPADLNVPDGSNDRTLIAKYLQSSIKQTYPPKPGMTYLNAEDRYVDCSGRKHEAGMKPPEQREARQALFGEEQVIKQTKETWIQNPPIGGLYTAITWVPKEGRRPAIGHAVIVVDFDHRNNRVIFRNPHRQQVYPADNDIIDEGPSRTSCDPETGLESMALKDFMARAPVSILSRSELEAYSPPPPLPAVPGPVTQPGGIGFWGRVGIVASIGTAAAVAGYAVREMYKGDGSAVAVRTISGPIEDVFGDKLLGARQLQTLFNRGVSGPAVPPTLTAELALKPAAINKNRDPVCNTHRLMLVEGGLGFNELNEMAENCGSSLQVGTFLSFSPINQIPGFDSLSGANTEWALVHDWETLSPSLQSAVVTDRSQPTQDLVRRIASEYRTASVGEIVLDTLCKKMSGEKPSDFTVISRNTSGPHPICVQYKEGVFTIGLPIDFESEEMGIFLSRTL